MNNLSLLSTLFVLLAAQVTFGQIPQTISYQGVLTDAEGNPVADSQVSLTFKLYDAAADGNMLWQETQQVDVAGGLINVILGSSNPLTPPFDAPYWLGISIGADPELQPRIELTAAAYSLNSRSTAAGGDGHSLDAADGNPTDVVFVDDGGKVGIGTTSPQFDFHLHRLSQFPVKLGVQWIGTSLPPQTVTDWFYYTVGGIGPGLGGTHMVRKSGHDLRFSTQDKILSGPSTEQMRLTANGDLGLGTFSPNHRLHVHNTDAASGGVARFTNDQGTLLDIGVSGSNTGWPVGNDNPYIFTNNKDLEIHTGSGNLFSNGGDVVVGNGGGILVSGGGKIDLMDINGNGPIISLDPTGITSGTITTPILKITGGSDLAEPFDIASSEAVKPGMVVAIDAKHPGQLRIADQAYDRTVAGCVSGANGINPGLTMQQEGSVADGSLPVALSGRVYCRADAAYGSIQPGDLLTTSDTPGHAMKVTDHARARGAILGKAMTTLAHGKGLVLILVTLQ